MARQVTRQRGAASPLGRRRLPGQSRKPVKITAVRSPSVTPIPAAAIKESRKSKTKQTVSVAGIFKNAKSTRQKHQKRREKTPEPDVLGDLADGIAEARETLSSKTRATFTEVHSGFLERLASIRTEDETFFQNMFEAAKTLTAPLADEEIRVEFIKDGKKVSGTHRVGDRVASFKKMIEEEEKKLDDLWKQWDEVQTEYVALGTEVFGREAFRIEKEGREIGYKKDMELLDLETAARVEALEDEIEAIGPEILKKMKASEKDLDAAAKKDQARLLSALL